MELFHLGQPSGHCVELVFAQQPLFGDGEQIVILFVHVLAQELVHFPRPSRRDGEAVQTVIQRPCRGDELAGQAADLLMLLQHLADRLVFRANHFAHLGTKRLFFHGDMRKEFAVEK